MKSEDPERHRNNCRGVNQGRHKLRGLWVVDLVYLGFHVLSLCSSCIPDITDCSNFREFVQPASSRLHTSRICLESRELIVHPQLIDFMGRNNQSGIIFKGGEPISLSAV